MDTAWIQVFVLVLSECVAPEGKTVCQQQEFELQFLDRADCERALEELVSLKGRMEDVIVDRDASGCVATARRRDTYPDLAAISAAHGDKEEWRAPPAEAADDGADLTREAHEERLARLPECSDGERPCKIGDIIVEEEEPEPIEVWRLDQ